MEIVRDARAQSWLPNAEVYAWLFKHWARLPGAARVALHVAPRVETLEEYQPAQQRGYRPGCIVLSMGVAMSQIALWLLIARRGKPDLWQELLWLS